jgi:ubiquinone/menaquinone biosynthesis C-methylase UbiE
VSTKKSHGKKSPRKPWYVRAFEKDYLARYAHRSDAAAALEIKFIGPLLNLPRGARVLDLCCGSGRHSRALAASGYNAIGIDLSAALLQEARSRKAREKMRGGEIQYVRADMRNLPLPARCVDGAISMFTSFGYFSSDGENARVLHEVERVMKPGGRFVMDYLNLKHTLSNLAADSERRVGAAVLREKRVFDKRTRRFKKSIEVRDGGKREVLRESVRAYTPRELKNLFKRAGLIIEAMFGDLEGAAFDETKSPRCIVLARKAARKK